MHDILWEQPIYRLQFLESIWSFSIDDGNGSEKFPVNEFTFHQTLLHLFAENVECRQGFQGLISWRLRFRREREIRHRLFRSSIKCAIRYFHTIVQRNVQKCMIPVQSCFS